jgi:hypothetical protein
MMTREAIAAKIEALQEDSQKRLSQVAQADSVWANLQGQMAAFNEMLGSMDDEAEQGGAEPTEIKQGG